MPAGRLITLFLLITVGDALRSEASGPLPVWPPPTDEAAKAKKPIVTGAKHVDEMVANLEDHSPMATAESKAPTVNLKKHVNEMAADWESKESEQKTSSPVLKSVGNSRVKKMAANYKETTAATMGVPAPRRVPKKLPKAKWPPSQETTDSDTEASSPGKLNVKGDKWWSDKSSTADADSEASSPGKLNVKGDKSWMAPEELNEKEVIDTFLEGGKAEDLPEIVAGGKHVKDIAENFEAENSIP